MKKKGRIENRIIAVILCMAILFSQVNIADAADVNPSGTNTSQVALSDDANKSNGEVSTESTVSDEINGTTESESKISEETSENSKNDESESSGGNVKAESTDNIDAYYKDSKICIYNYEQLKQIGSDAYIYTGDKDGQIGSGEVVKSEGTELKYGADAQYILMNDIQMNSEQIWSVPDSFTGTITGTKLEENETPTLYDKETDTIYIYNPYQLMVLAQEESETEPVMSMDYDAPQFGMGQMIYPDGEDQEYLTYSKSHNYVLSQKFNSDKPELVADQLTEKAANGVQWLDGEHADGRTKPGQLYVEVSGKKYILIGNESQLRAIGSNKSVTPRLYVYYKPGLVTGLFGGNPFYSPYYPGDADLGLDAVAKEGATTHGLINPKPDNVKGENSYLYYKDKTNGVENGKYKLANVNLSDDNILAGLLKGVGGLLGTLLGGLTVGTGEFCGVNENGLPDKNIDKYKLRSEYGNLKYSSNANYIIFRDIDLSKDGVNSNQEDDLWTPLMVSGDIKGAKLADGQATLTDGNSILATGRPVISNVNVNQTEEMDGSKYIGIGFFGTITNEVNVNNIGVSAGTVSVSNLELRNVNVQNNTNKHKNTQTIISGLTSGLGWLVGGVVDLLVGVLSFGSVKLNLQDTLSALLNARAKDPTIYATGAFAGRLVGDVSIENCDVTGKVSVSNINDRTGGFVGYTEGVTQYDGLSKALGVTVNALSSLLNAIPGLGLGDLITILLDNALPVGSLIPTGYKNVNIKNCHVENLEGTVGAADKDYAGGFVGQQVGTRIFDCSVKNSSYSVTVKEYGGGFAGISRDAEIRGLLSDVGVELIRVMQPQSILLNCNLTGCNVSVSGENYQGGIVGAQTNSYAVNCGASGSIAVKASESYAGGVSGISTVGWITNLGSKEVKNESLLTTVKDLLTGLLSSDPEKAGMLLSLVGIAPSAILGCNMDCSSVSVEVGKSYSGGILGGGDGVYIAESSTEYLNKLPYWKHGGADASSVAQRDNVLYGPLALMDYETWNKWVEFVGKKGGYGSDLAEHGTVSNQAELDAIIGKYAYGYNVVAGRVNYRDETKLANGGAAGGYVGSMQTGTITNGQAYQAKTIKGLRCAGGFAGEMINGGAAKLGGVDILGLNLQLGQMLQVLNVFVPVIKKSSVEGYQSGLIVQSEGVDDKDTCGYAGGYVGKLIGGQIWGENDARCKVTKLRRVDGRSYVGGFVGSSRPGSVSTLDPTAGEGLLSQLLNKLLSTPADLIKVLNATVATIRYADVEAWDDWGIIVNGAYASESNNTSYAKAAGGFAGNLEGTVLGKKDTEEAGVSVQNIRSVVAGEYAGGCFGVADVAGVANISAGNETSLLDKLLKLGRTDVLDAFRSYVYYGTVSGSKDAGLSVSANTAIKSGQNNQVTYSGTAGGFGGSLLNGSVKNSKVTELSNVRGLNSVGGFVGYSGKSGVVKADKIDVIGDNTGQLLGGALGVMDIFGSHIDDCAVTGTDEGYTVQSTNGDEQIAGGFIGYANLARMSNCTAGDKTNQKIGLKQVASGGTAGGFAGRTSFAYLADLKLDSGAVNVIFSLVNELIKALYLDKIQDSNLLKINLGIIKVDALYDGKLLHVNLLGLDISVGLSKKSTDNDQRTDLAIITIGDSSIKLPCDENGLLNDNDAKSNISVSLIKANRTRITDSNVYGVSHGYDVYAGGAGNNNDGDAKDGRSGGFVGFNDEGLLKNNNMYYCDVVRGTKDLVGPFSGKSELDSQYQFNTLDKVEGENNNYRIYRKLDQSLDEIKKNNSILNSSHEKDDASGWDIYTIGHMNPVKTFETLKNAVLASKSDSVKADLNAYESPAKAVLMSDTKTTLNTGESGTPEPSESQDPCDEHIKLTINKVWKDLNNLDKKRPDNITVTISRTWTDAAGKEQTETVPGYGDYIISGSSDKSTWQEVIKGLPAYTTDENKTIHYYTYSVTETKIDGYTTTIKKSDDGFTFTITNKHFPGLPDTGGYGSYLIYLIAVLLFLVYFIMRYKKCKENKKAEKL